jgi:predicted phage terminase large subunit-like protein
MTTDLSIVPEEVLKEALLLMESKAKFDLQEAAQKNFMPFVHHVYDGFIEGSHHRQFAERLERVASGELKRLIINVPPRHTKSEFASYLLPAWFLGRNPKLKIIEATHNTDLATRFGRKVRDLIDDPEYRRIFPETKLREDNKSSGSWGTTAGGEYFACITPDTRVMTSFGPIEAGLVKVGDKLKNASGEVEVLEVYHSTHDATIHIGDLKCSANHPVWTVNRGWVEGADICLNDILCVVSIFDSLKVFIGRIIHGFMEHANVPPLVQHQVSLREPEKRKILLVRRARDLCVRALAGFSRIFSGYGGATVAYAHGGSDRQRWSVQPGELSLGDTSRSEQQQAHECAYRGQDDSGERSRFGRYAGDDTVSIGARSGASESREKAQSPLQEDGPPDDIGRLRRFALQFFGGGRSRNKPRQATKWFEKRLEGLYWRSQKLQGLLLGVRRAGPVTVETHAPRHFVNYLVSGDHTFFADGVLTHNCGVGAAMTGRGADLLVIDDPHSEQDALSPTAFEHAYEWYTSGPRQRLQPGAAIVVVMTRWGETDLTGRLLDRMASDPLADQWEVVEFPAILPNDKPLWPEFWTMEGLLSVKASLPAQKWEAQWQQKPTSSQSSIVKREWWQEWDKDKIPDVDYIIQAYDTAFGKSESADYSAITTWGIFNAEDGGGDNIILLDARKGRWNFPELKEVAFDEHKYWEPDLVLVEAKASGRPLIDELSLRGITALPFSPGKRKGGGGIDKVFRMNLVSPLFESGRVWYPKNKRFAEEVIEEMAAFPFGAHDDYCDSATLALMRFREGRFVRLQTDVEEEEYIPPRKREYY